ncbi:hypothetical protein FSPOR_1648 [Fusarium sporotrichioides]|uniref:Uncharacterized protein n=1 Tax=Fusarium sporotrichioides TaxID=5514 RepID=A0A395SNC3_FUSSP|nr:hypothetical protein FSPOR_1648 [Fusarium sporotrichioides]
MKPSQIVYGLYLLLPCACAGVISDTCVAVDILPLITVNKGPGGYENEYVRCYSDLSPGGLTTKIYTITQTCLSINCQPPPLETAPPPGFTHAVIQCDSCNSSHAQIATLTFPSDSMSAYSASGYVVLPALEPPTGGLASATVSPVQGPGGKIGSNGGWRPTDSSDVPIAEDVDTQGGNSVTLEDQDDSNHQEEWHSKVSDETPAQVESPSGEEDSDSKSKGTSAASSEEDEQPDLPAEDAGSDSPGSNTDGQASSSTSLPLEGAAVSGAVSSSDSDDSDYSGEHPVDNTSDSTPGGVSATSNDTFNTPGDGSDASSETNNPQENEDKDIQGGNPEGASGSDAPQEPIMVSNAVLSKTSVFQCVVASVTFMILSTLL